MFPVLRMSELHADGITLRACGVYIPLEVFKEMIANV